MTIEMSSRSISERRQKCIRSFTLLATIMEPSTSAYFLTTRDGTLFAYSCLPRTELSFDGRVPPLVAIVCAAIGREGVYERINRRAERDKYRPAPPPFTVRVSSLGRDTDALALLAL